MTYIGELISIGVAFSWTATALLSELGSKRLGNLQFSYVYAVLPHLKNVDKNSETESVESKKAIAMSKNGGQKGAKKSLAHAADT